MAVGRLGKTDSREVPARAPTCLRFNYDALAGRPQPTQSRYNTCFVLFSGTLLELTATWRRRARKDPRIDHKLGAVYVPTLVLYLSLAFFSVMSPHEAENLHFYDHFGS